MKKLLQILNILSWPVYICIAAYLLIAAPLVLGYRPVVVLSGSMEPTFSVGSVIYYKDTPFNEIKVGDPITFRAGGGDALVTHRVTEKQEISQTFTTKGDANNTEDPNPVQYQNVVGRAASFCIPYAGYFVDFGKQPKVIAIMAAVLLAGILVEQVSKKDEESEQKQQ